MTVLSSDDSGLEAVVFSRLAAATSVLAACTLIPLTEQTLVGLNGSGSWSWTSGNVPSIAVETIRDDAFWFAVPSQLNTEGIWTSLGNTKSWGQELLSWTNDSNDGEKVLAVVVVVKIFTTGLSLYCAVNSMSLTSPIVLMLRLFGWGGGVVSCGKGVSSARLMIVSSFSFAPVPNAAFEGMRKLIAEFANTMLLSEVFICGMRLAMSLLRNSSVPFKESSWDFMGISKMGSSTNWRLGIVKILFCANGIVSDAGAHPSVAISASLFLCVLRLGPKPSWESWLICTPATTFWSILGDGCMHSVFPSFTGGDTYSGATIVEFEAVLGTHFIALHVPSQISSAFSSWSTIWLWFEVWKSAEASTQLGVFFIITFTSLTSEGAAGTGKLMMML